MIVTRIWPQYLSGLLWSLSYFSLILTVLVGGGRGGGMILGTPVQRLLLQSLV